MKLNFSIIGNDGKLFTIIPYNDCEAIEYDFITKHSCIINKEYALAYYGFYTLLKDLKNNINVLNRIIGYSKKYTNDPTSNLLSDLIISENKSLNKLYNFCSYIKGDINFDIEKLHISIVQE